MFICPKDHIRESMNRLTTTRVRCWKAQAQAQAGLRWSCNRNRSWSRCWLGSRATSWSLSRCPCCQVTRFQFGKRAVQSLDADWGQKCAGWWGKGSAGGVSAKINSGQRQQSQVASRDLWCASVRCTRDWHEFRAQNIYMKKIKTRFVAELAQLVMAANSDCCAVWEPAIRQGLAAWMRSRPH